MGFIRAQRTRVPQIVPTNLSNKTVLITGSNAGLGYEAARAVLPHKPSRLILAVRNLDKGDAARKELDKVKATSTKIETRKLDQSSFSSVRAFAKELNGERIDIALLNAGVWNSSFTTTPDGLESDLQVNVLAPALLSLLLLPNLRLALPSTAHLTFVSSGLHENAKFPERTFPRDRSILAALSDPSQYGQQDRYPTTKTIGLFWARELAQRVAAADIVVNSATPGFCKTGFARNMAGMMGWAIKATEALLGREAADGARVLVDAAVVKGKETHGKYISEMKVKDESRLVRSGEGEELQKRLWEEIVELLRVKAGLEGENVP